MRTRSVDPRLQQIHPIDCLKPHDDFIELLYPAIDRLQPRQTAAIRQRLPSDNHDMARRVQLPIKTTQSRLDVILHACDATYDDGDTWPCGPGRDRVAPKALLCVAETAIFQPLLVKVS